MPNPRARLSEPQPGSPRLPAVASNPSGAPSWPARETRSSGAGPRTPATPRRSLPQPQSGLPERPASPRGLRAPRNKGQRRRRGPRAPAEGSTVRSTSRARGTEGSRAPGPSPRPPPTLDSSRGRGAPGPGSFPGHGYSRPTQTLQLLLSRQSAQRPRCTPHGHIHGTLTTRLSRAWGTGEARSTANTHARARAHTHSHLLSHTHHKDARKHPWGLAKRTLALLPMISRARAYTHTHTHTHTRRPPERREIPAGCHPFGPRDVDYTLHSPVQVNEGRLSLLPSDCPRAEGCTCHPGGPLSLLSVQLQALGTISALCPANRRGCLSPGVWPEKLTTSFLPGQQWIFRPTRGKQHPGPLATNASPLQHTPPPSPPPPPGSRPRGSFRSFPTCHSYQSFLKDTNPAHVGDSRPRAKGWGPRLHIRGERTGTRGAPFFDLGAQRSGKGCHLCKTSPHGPRRTCSDATGPGPQPRATPGAHSKELGRPVGAGRRRAAAAPLGWARGPALHSSDGSLTRIRLQSRGSSRTLSPARPRKPAAGRQFGPPNPALPPRPPTPPLRRPVLPCHAKPQSPLSEVGHPL
uniref:Basic proline-rich protein-like n=1 Tax=Mustela putorius furo TaxID=9669 RepID=M3Z5M7_MUSPF